MRTAILLRAINLPHHHKLSMPQVKQLLERAGHRDVATYLHSGNVVAAREGRQHRTPA